MTIYFYLSGLAIVLQNVIRFWAYTSCFKLKVKASIGYAVYLSITTAATFFSLYYQVVNNSMLSIILLLAFLFYFLPFHFLTYGSIFKKFMLYIIDQIVIDPLIEFILYTTIVLIYQYETVPGVFDYGRFLGMVVFCLFSAPIKYVMVKIWKKANKIDDEKFNPLFLIFPIGQIIASFIAFQFVRYYAEKLWETENLLIALIYNIVLTLSSIIYIFFLSDVEKKNKLEREYNALNYTRQIEETRYSAIEKKQLETAKIRHDIKNQLIAIKGLLSSGNSDEAETLIQELETDINGSKEKEYCSVPIINALLFEKEKICVKEGIDLECDITIYDTGCISKNHLCSIFSNLMDNAINECKSLNGADKKIKVTAAQKNGFISVRCENTAKGDKHRIIRPSESKGYGMKILQDIANRYKGRYKCEINEGKCLSEITVNILKQE